MYFNHLSLIQDLKEDKITAKEVFFHMNRLTKGERRKFIHKAKDYLLIK